MSTSEWTIDFADAESVDAVVYQAIGAGSKCWESMDGTGVFQDQQASAVGAAAVARLAELLGVIAPYEVIDRIESGEWDRYLGRLLTALQDRVKTDGFLHHNPTVSS